MTAWLVGPRTARECLGSLKAGRQRHALKRGCHFQRLDDVAKIGRRKPHRLPSRSVTSRQVRQRQSMWNDDTAGDGGLRTPCYKVAELGWAQPRAAGPSVALRVATSR